MAKGEAASRAWHVPGLLMHGWSVSACSFQPYILGPMMLWWCPKASKLADNYDDDVLHELRSWPQTDLILSHVKRSS